MKNLFRKFCSLVIAAVALVTALCSVPAVCADENIRDSGIDYTETTETINNPGAGYTNAVWYVCRPGDTPVYNPEGNLVVLFIDIGGFSSGANGVTDEASGEYTEGTDYDFDDAFFEGLRATFENCRNNGCTLGLRFRYDADGKSNPEPSSFEKVLSHIEQIKENGILDDYEDILVYVESGFVGAWGEQHSGKYTSVEYKAKLLDAVLKAVPKSVAVTVRTPDIFCKWAGIEYSEPGSYIAPEGSDAARVGMFDDGYMGSDSDLGTYGSVKRADAVKWMNTQMKNTYFGGEFSWNTDFAQKYDTWLPENSIPEMYETHLSYINSNIWSLYRDFEYTAELNTSGADNSAYYGQSVYKFIRDHIGYRFVLRSSELTAETVQGGKASVNFSVENTGFANPVKPQKACVILEQNGYYMITGTDTDSKRWDSASVVSESLDITLPGNISAGDWNVYLKLSAGNDSVTDTRRTVRFANAEIYDGLLGANYLGTIHVDENREADKSRLLSEAGAAEASDGRLYSLYGKMNTDGAVSRYEWSENDIAAVSEECTLYTRCDDSFLYVCAEMPDRATAPVYNLSLQGEEPDAKKYWIYYASNGYVYFNGDDRSGVQCGYSGGTVEFRIPFGSCMELSDGKTLKFLRVDIQDSDNDWTVTGDLKAENLTVSSSVIRGDANSDGEVNSADAVTVQRWLLGAMRYEVFDSTSADMNEDEKISIQDLILIKNSLVADFS